FTASYFVLGADRAFQPASYEVSTLWMAVMLVVSIVSAIAGGYVCAAIAKRKGAVTALIVVVLVLGLLNMIPAMTAASTPEVRTADVSNMEAMMKGREPTWFVLLLPIIGAVGVWVGGRHLRG